MIHSTVRTFSVLSVKIWQLSTILAKGNTEIFLTYDLIIDVLRREQMLTAHYLISGKSIHFLYDLMEVII